MAAPRAEMSEGLMAVGEVEGESTVVLAGKSDWISRAILGVWDVPPDSMTCKVSVRSRGTRRQKA